MCPAVGCAGRESLEVPCGLQHQTCSRCRTRYGYNEYIKHLKEPARCEVKYGASELPVEGASLAERARFAAATQTYSQYNTLMSACGGDAGMVHKVTFERYLYAHAGTVDRPKVIGQLYSVMTLRTDEGRFLAKYLYSKESGCTLFTNIKAFLAALPNEYDFVHGDKLEKIYTALVTEKALGPWDPIEITPAELRPHPDPSRCPIAKIDGAPGDGWGRAREAVDGDPSADVHDTEETRRRMCRRRRVPWRVRVRWRYDSPKLKCWSCSTRRWKGLHHAQPLCGPHLLRPAAVGV